jgi:hypothetical protein
LSGDPRDTGIRAFADAATKRPHYYWIFRGIDHRSVCANCPDGVLREAAQARIAVCARTVNAAAGPTRWSGHCVELPDDNPVGATARCADGTYSHSEHPEYSGTCSDQGGVVDDDLSEHDEHLNDD